jgi:hypothetical protein
MPDTVTRALDAAADAICPHFGTACRLCRTVTRQAVRAYLDALDPAEVGARMGWELPPNTLIIRDVLKGVRP